MEYNDLRMPERVGAAQRLRVTNSELTFKTFEIAFSSIRYLKAHLLPRRVT